MTAVIPIREGDNLWGIAEAVHGRNAIPGPHDGKFMVVENLDQSQVEDQLHLTVADRKAARDYLRELATYRVAEIEREVAYHQEGQVWVDAVADAEAAKIQKASETVAQAEAHLKALPAPDGVWGSKSEVDYLAARQFLQGAKDDYDYYVEQSMRATKAAQAHRGATIDTARLRLAEAMRVHADLQGDGPGPQGPTDGKVREDAAAKPPPVPVEDRLEEALARIAQLEGKTGAKA